MAQGYLVKGRVHTCSSSHWHRPVVKAQEGGSVEKTIRGCFQKTYVSNDTFITAGLGNLNFSLLLFSAFLYDFEHLQSPQLKIPYRSDGSPVPILQCFQWLRDSQDVPLMEWEQLDCMWLAILSGSSLFHLLLPFSYWPVWILWDETSIDSTSVWRFHSSGAMVMFKLSDNNDGGLLRFWVE